MQRFVPLVWLDKCNILEALLLTNIQTNVFFFFLELPGFADFVSTQYCNFWREGFRGKQTADNNWHLFRINIREWRLSAKPGGQGAFDAMAAVDEESALNRKTPDNHFNAMDRFVTAKTAGLCRERSRSIDFHAVADEVWNRNGHHWFRLTALTLGGSCGFELFWAYWNTHTQCALARCSAWGSTYRFNCQ